MDQLDASEAAVTHQHWTKTKEEHFPKMVWNSNNARLAAGTMWTLFFAGNDFAPKTHIDGVPVQEYLQSHFLAMMGKVAETLKDESNVVGFDILNEPSVGFVGVQDVRDIGPVSRTLSVCQQSSTRFLTHVAVLLACQNKYYVGARVDVWSAMKMGVGETCSVDYFCSFMHIDGKRELNKVRYAL